MTEPQFIIYGLVDPRTDEIRYVGKSTSGMKRPAWHRVPSSLRKRSYKTHWIKQLHQQGLTYRIQVLQEKSAASELAEAEICWIADLRAKGVALTNLTAGGEGTSGRVPTAEQLARWHQSMRAYLADTARHGPLRAKAAAQAQDPVTLALLRQAREKRWRQPGARKKQSISAKQRFTDPQERLAQSRINGGGPFVDQHGNRYGTQHQAARALHLRQGHISEVLSGARRSAGGYVFTYLEASHA